MHLVPCPQCRGMARPGARVRTERPWLAVIVADVCRPGLW